MEGMLRVEARFNGPLESGNGGYSAGVFAALVGGPAEVSLRSPVPLDTPLAARAAEDGAFAVLDGETLVAEVRPASGPPPEVPEPVGLAEAHAAAERYRGLAEGPFSRCFVCGRGRPDAFGVFAGAVAGRDVVASPWTPPVWTAADGLVRPEFAWAVLDCPTYFAAYPDDLPLSVLARISAWVEAPIEAGTEHVVIAWPLGAEGRKSLAGSAVLSAAGEVLARAEVLMVELRDQPAPTPA